MARPNGRPGEGKAAGPPAQVRGPEPGNRALDQPQLWARDMHGAPGAERV